MSIQLNHTIVHSHNKAEAASFMADILGLPAPKAFYHFLVVQADNGVSFDFLEHKGDFTVQHYAFLVEEQEFDAIFARIKKRRLSYWADPAAQRPQEINTNDGGRGLYFRDPSGHVLEILTRPYGSSVAQS